MSCLRDFLLVVQELCLLLLKSHQIRIQHHALGTLAGRESLDIRLRIYLGTRSGHDGWCSEYHWRCRSHWVDHLHLVDSHTVLPPHVAMIPARWRATLTSVTGYQSYYQDYGNCGDNWIHRHRESARYKSAAQARDWQFDSLPPVALPDNFWLPYREGFVASPGLPAMPTNYKEKVGEQV